MATYWTWWADIRAGVFDQIPRYSRSNTKSSTRSWKCKHAPNPIFNLSLSFEHLTAPCLFKTMQRHIYSPKCTHIDATFCFWRKLIANRCRLNHIFVYQTVSNRKETNIIEYKIVSKIITIQYEQITNAGSVTCLHKTINNDPYWKLTCSSFQLPGFIGSCQQFTLGGPWWSAINQRSSEKLSE